MIGYQSRTPKLATTLGNRVGDPFASLRAVWGSGLRPLNLGGRSTRSSGSWYVAESNSRKKQITFTLVGGRVSSIFGGYTNLGE